MALNFQQNEATSVRRIVFGALLAASLVLTTVYCREGDGGPLHAIQGAFGVVASPMRNVGAHVGSAIESTGDSVADATADDATLAELREQKKEAEAAYAAAKENGTLEEKKTVGQRIKGVFGGKKDKQEQADAAKADGAKSQPVKVEQTDAAKADEQK